MGVDLNPQPWQFRFMATPIEIWLFLNSRARRKFGVKRIQRDCQAHFGQAIDPDESEQIILEARHRKRVVMSRCDCREDLFNATRDAYHRAMMEYGSRKLKEAIDRARG